MPSPSESTEQPATYTLTLQEVADGPPILADYPHWVEPLQTDRRFLAPPLVDDANGTVLVRAWRYWYNVRGIVETENRLDARATAAVMVHPWGLDDDHGLPTPEPAGIAFLCTPEKNRIGLEHVREVVDPFLARIRGDVRLVAYSMPGVEDPIRRRLYASIGTEPDQLRPEDGERLLAERYAAHAFGGKPLVRELALDPRFPVRDFMAQTPSTDAGDRYNGPGYWDLPMPVSSGIQRAAADRVFYDGEGYPKVRDYLLSQGIRHILLLGYCTDMCVIRTTCGWENLIQDFNVFLVGDATLATFPASTTPRFATQVALVNSALQVMVTQVSWVRAEALR